MKTIEQIKSGKNYTAVNVGRMSEIIEHELPMGPNVIQGKVFVGQAVGTTGSELSFQTLVPGGYLVRLIMGFLQQIPGRKGPGHTGVAFRSKDVHPCAYGDAGHRLVHPPSQEFRRRSPV